MEFILGAALFGVGLVVVIAVSSDVFWDVKKRRDEREQHVSRW